MLSQEQKKQDLDFLKSKLDLGGNWIVLASQMYFSMNVAAANFKVSDDELGVFVSDLFENFNLSLKRGGLDVESSIKNILTEDSIKHPDNFTISCKSTCFGADTVADRESALFYTENVIGLDESYENSKDDERYSYFIFIKHALGQDLLCNGDFQALSVILLLKSCVGRLLTELRKPEERQQTLANIAFAVKARL